MLRSELPARLAKRFSQLTEKDCAEAVDLVLGALVSALAAGDRIEIRGFGSFSVHRVSPRTGRNPKTGELVAIPAKARPHFKPGQDLRARVDIDQ